MRILSVIRSKNERRVIIATSVIVLCFALFAIVSLFTWIPTVLPFSSDAFEDVAQELGSLARFAFFFAFGFYILKISLPRLPQSKIKSVGQTLFKYVRLYHVPAALVGFLLASFHGLFMFLYKWTWSLSTVSGLIAQLLLLVLAGFGLLRYERKDHRLHLILAIAFVVLFMLHGSVFPSED
ncbi:MAG: hypothetical protein ACRC5C_03865 [Bacilli bacterium]